MLCDYGELESIRIDFLGEIENIKMLGQIRDFRASFLGRKSKISALLSGLAGLSLEQKRDFGVKVNELRDFMAHEVAKREDLLKQEQIELESQTESLDVTVPPRQSQEGLLSPISWVQAELRDLLYSMGFSYTRGSEIENDWNCFEGLNMPAHHPARQMQDTFYLRNDDREKILLRTQTTSVYMREMSKHKPPFKFFVTGKTFRSEMDATHAPMFHQVDGVYIDKNVNLQDLKNCLITICKKFFGLKTVPLRLRPSYFPFTTPSIEVDIKCDKTDSRKLVPGEGNDWMEILGAGMVHPNVMRNGNMDPDEYQGFAFGFGIERMAMLKYGIRDIRNLYDGNMAFLRHYGFRMFE
ncbi:MAG: phenylalanine--tRNA ligase subunit alpha [Rickettsiales bacterium]|jgi:phenylalanyl-tRNA synthetase alpha chain|nr:phenylalanine--tRNA ligase subunit alpha [Rickettsiales bacterium]